MKNIILTIIFGGSIITAHCGNEDDISKLYGSGYKGKDQYYKDYWKGLGFSVDMVAFKEFVTKVKTLDVGADTADDVIQKVGNPKNKFKSDGEEVWNYEGYVSEPYLISSVIKIGSDGKLKQVKITKAKDNNVQDVFNKSLSDLKKMDTTSTASSVPKHDKLVASVLADAPPTPDLGQIYLNITDSHFYGWNGKEWKQLDK